MEIVRHATMADQAQIRALWRICFGDTERFMDWFFQERYFPHLSSILTLSDGTIASALQSYPLHLRLRDQILPGSMLAGVSTRPDMEGRGYMKRIFLHYMHSVRENGGVVAFHTPAHLPTFFSRGHLPATNTRKVTFTAPMGELPQGVRPAAMGAGLAPLHACYQLATARYSGMVSRSLSDFMQKFRDYASDGGACLALYEGERVSGYCVYYLSDDRLHAEEVLALDEAAYGLLLQALAHAAKGREAGAKLPPDTTAALPGMKEETKPQGVMGVANVQSLLRALVGDKGVRVAVTDEAVPENQGIWDGLGQSAINPGLTISAGRLGQFLGGYASLRELADLGLAAGDPGLILELDERFPKQDCYIVDEY